MKTVMLGFETFDDMGKDSRRSFELQVIVYLLQAILKYSEVRGSFQLLFQLCWTLTNSTLPRSLSQIVTI